MPKLPALLLASVLLFACSQEVEQKPTTPLVINTSNGEIRFHVEVAQTADELQKGLMHRTEMPLNNGMIFNIYPVRPTAMWMKNTKIALDMLFIAPDATISMIRENATPMSEELIISRDPVRAVVELNAGQVKKHGIKIGDKVSHNMLSNLITLSDVAIPQPALSGANGPVVPKGPNANPGGPVIPKGPNANLGGPVIPKGPNANPGGPVIPKGPNANPGGLVIPKGPNANPGGPVIPKGPNAGLPVPPPM